MYHTSRDELNILDGGLEVGNGSPGGDRHHEGAVKRLHNDLHLIEELLVARNLASR